MPFTGTVIAGLVYRSGVLIGSDSQASDPQPGIVAGNLMVGVRWTTSKLRTVGPHPLVAGFSGQTGTSERLFAALDAASIHPNQFRKRLLVQNALDRIYKPEYVAAAARSAPPPGMVPIMVQGLAAVWAEGGPGLVEHELNGDSSWHDYFHAIGSGKPTAYAVYRALGGKELCNLSERTAILALLRILQTTVNVEMAFVSEPLHIWRVDANGATQYGEVELDHHREAVAKWEAEDQTTLFRSDAVGDPA